MAFTEVGPAELSRSAAIRIAACGPSDQDRRALDQLLRGASYDHLGGGFHDYPGGPKRLETNAWALNALIATHEARPDLFVRNAALDTVAFALRDLKDADGAFFRSIGNDRTETYFAFSEPEIRAALGPDKSREFFDNFALTPGGFPRLTGSPFAGLSDTRQTLLLRRLRRIRLPLDDVIDPDANGVWVGALARTAAVLQRRDFMEAAQRAATVLATMPNRGGAGAAFGFAALERFDRGRATPDLASRALDRALAKSATASGTDFAILALTLADQLRLHPSDARGRQLTRVVRELERRFPNTDAAQAAGCAAATVVRRAPAGDSRPPSPSR